MCVVSKSCKSGFSARSDYLQEHCFLAIYLRKGEKATKVDYTEEKANIRLRLDTGDSDFHATPKRHRNTTA